MRSARRIFNSRFRSGGFTLIEVLVTLLLIGIVMPAILHGITIAAAAGSAARHRNEAAELAKSQLAQIVAGSEWKTASLSGDFSPNWPDYRWQATAQPWDLDTSGMGIQEIDLVVSWMEGGHNKSMSLSTLAYARGQSQ